VGLDGILVAWPLLRRRRAESVALLARGGRSTEAWVRDLRSLGSGDAAYRAASLPPETLVRIATDPAETEELRIGAALEPRRR